MVAETVEIPTVAKKRGRPKSDHVRGNGRAVRIDPDIVGKARVVAMRRNLEVGPYLSKLLEAPVNKDYFALLRELSKEQSE